MGFQIKDKEGDAIAINILDKEVCEFWGIDVHKKHYAVPVKRGSNWFDAIGHMIHSPLTVAPYYGGWKEVKKNLILMHLESSMLKDDGTIQEGDWVKGMFEHTVNDHMKPFLTLIDHWEGKGYTPHQVKE